MARRGYGRGGYRGGGYGRRGHDEDWMAGCIGLLILLIFAMPILGLYFITKRDGTNGTKAAGWCLLILGIIIWIVVGVNMKK